MQSHFRPLGSRAQLMMGLAVAWIAFSAPLLRADEAPAQLHTALQKLEAWLTTSDYADGWNQYLKTDLLRAELAKGAGADKKSVAEVLTQYQSNVPDLNKPRFVAVRSALQLWLTQLSAITPDQLPQAAGDAHVEFRPPTAEQVAGDQSGDAEECPGIEPFSFQKSCLVEGLEKISSLASPPGAAAEYGN